MGQVKGRHLDWAPRSTLHPDYHGLASQNLRVNSEDPDFSPVFVGVFHHTRKATSFAWCFRMAEGHLGNRNFFYSKEEPLFMCVLFTLKDNLLAVFWFSVYGISLVNFCPVSKWNQCFISLSTICYFCGSRTVMNLLFIIINNQKKSLYF